MTVSGVRKSCTTPESIWPIAASRSRCSASSRLRRTLIDRPACPAMSMASRSSLSVNPDGLFSSASAPTTPSSTVMGTREHRVGPDVEPRRDARVVPGVVGGACHAHVWPVRGDVTDDALPRLQLHRHQGLGLLPHHALEVERALRFAGVDEEDRRRGGAERGGHPGEQRVHEVALLLRGGHRLLGLEEEVRSLSALDRSDFALRSASFWAARAARRAARCRARRQSAWPPPPPGPGPRR